MFLMTLYELYMTGYQLGTIHIHFQLTMSNYMAKNVDFVTTHNYIVYMICIIHKLCKIGFLCTLYGFYIAGYQFGTIHIHFQTTMSIIWPKNVDFVTTLIVLYIYIYMNCAKSVFDD